MVAPLRPFSWACLVMSAARDALPATSSMALCISLMAVATMEIASVCRVIPSLLSRAALDSSDAPEPSCLLRSWMEPIMAWRFSST